MEGEREEEEESGQTMVQVQADIHTEEQTDQGELPAQTGAAEPSQSDEPETALEEHEEVCIDNTEAVPLETPPHEILRQEIRPIESPLQEIPPQEILPQEIPPQEIPPQEILPLESPPQEILPQEIPPQEILPLETPPQEIPPQEILPQEILPLETSLQETQVNDVDESLLQYLSTPPEDETVDRQGAVDSSKKQDHPTQLCWYCLKSRQSEETKPEEGSEPASLMPPGGQKVKYQTDPRPHFGVACSSRSTPLPLWGSEGPRWEQRDQELPDQTHTCPHCHLGLPPDTLLWHEEKCLLYEVLKNSETK